ncbi:TasA family protein [Effusibacillus consociatus]|uniref:TasA family protein n=1 Tax=Effusibacillus consociatus TaxID=1117041 RepID=A0ABV9PW90_9BACL
MGIKEKIGLALATTALGASLVGAGTFAIFTDSATNTANTFTAGTLNIEKEGEVEFTGNVTNLAPGDSGTETFDIANRGNLQLRYDVAQAITNGAIPLTGVNAATDLAFTIQRSVDNGVTWSNVTPGDNNFVLNPGAVDKYRVNYSLPLAAGNAYQGGSASYQLTFSAEQTRNN